ncbi:MAG: hypothetical protein QM762_02420 [Chryseolinea sp.]
MKLVRMNIESPQRIVNIVLWISIVLSFRHRIFLFILLSSYSADGQTSSFANELRTKLERYYNEEVPLNIEAQFNQPSYVAGDTAWFSLWLTTEKNGLPLADRQIVHVDVETRSGNVIQQLRVLVKNGRGHGQFIIPPSLQAGAYIVLFSTGWSDTNSRICGYNEFFISGEQVFSPRQMGLQAHLEGGVLTEGVSNHITVTGRSGATVSVLVDDKVMQRVVLDNLGYGNFKLVPVSSSDYALNDGYQMISLPKSKKGVGLTLMSYDSASMLVFKLESTQSRDACNLAIVSRGKLVYTAMIGFQSGAVSIAIPRRNLPEGILLATVFDGHDQPLAERLLIANLHGNALKIMPHETVMKPRGRMSITVDAPDFLTPLTVSIRADDMFLSSQQAQRSPVYVQQLPIDAIDFRTDSAWTLQQWNEFLVTQRWDRFSWSEVWDASSRNYRPEKYLRFKGKILQSLNSDYDSVRITFFLRNDARVYEEFVDQNGAFDVELFFDFYSSEDVVYVIDRNGVIIPGASLTLDKESAPLVKFSPFVKSDNPDPYFAFAKFRDSIMSAYTNYRAVAGKEQVEDPNGAVEEELFSADVAVRLDDYVLFPSMEETLREIIPRLQHRWKGKRHTVTVALSDPDGLAAHEPVYFIDGVLTDNTDYFMGLRPVDVATIKVVSSHRKLSALGILGRNGVVLVTTKIPNNYLNVPRFGNSVKVSGIIPSMQFKNASTFSTRIPELRSTVYFNSNVIPDAQGQAVFEFSLPDNTGLFRIEVTGMTKTGAIVKTVSHVRSVPPTTTP